MNEVLGLYGDQEMQTQGQVHVYYKDIFYYVLIMYVKNILHKIDISSDF